MGSARASVHDLKRQKSLILRSSARRGVEALEHRTLLASIIVNSNADNAIPGDGLVTLREAIIAANNDSTTDTGQTGSGADQITFNLGGAPRFIQLMSALPTLNSDLSIVGPSSAERVSIGRLTQQQIRIFTVTAGKTVTLENLEILRGNVPFSSGGGVSNFGGNLTVRSCSFYENTAQFGGAIANLSGGVLHLITTALSQNNAGSDGGGLYNTSGARATFQGCTVTGNNAQRWGGAAYGMTNAALTFENSSISFNRAGDDAGGIDIAQGSSLRLIDSHFSYNGAPGFGGAIRAGLGCLTNIDRCTFNLNESAHGGAMYNRGVLNVYDTSFTANFCTAGAGALDNDGGFKTIIRCTFDGNRSLGGGGALWNHVDSTAHVIDSYFSNNSAGEGGAITNRERATMTIRGCEFFSNQSNSWGGGIFNNFGTVSVDDSTFHGNTAVYDGGAINTNDGAIFINGSTFSENRASRGGALYNHFGGEMRVTNSTLYRNGGNIGTGIFSHALLELRHTTVADNWLLSGSGGPAVFNEFGSVLLHGTVVARNAGGDVIAIDPAISDVFSFIGNVDGDPMLDMLGDNGGPTRTMRVLPGSPLINAGDPVFGGSPVFDQRGFGFNRLIGGRVDIGAFEYNATPTTTGLGNLTVPEDAGDRIVHLRDFFNDVEDGATGLAYSIVGSTNTALFASTGIDDVDGRLLLDFAADHHGVADLTIRATDRNGGYVESTLAVTVLSVGQQVDLLAQRVDTVSGLNDGQRTALLARLSLNGNPGDVHKIQSFMRTVEAFAGAGRIALSDAQDLLNAASDLLISLG